MGGLSAGAGRGTSARRSLRGHDLQPCEASIKAAAVARQQRHTGDGSMRTDPEIRQHHGPLAASTPVKAVGLRCQEKRLLRQFGPLQAKGL